MKNNELNQGVTEAPKYILIKIEWDSKLLMPIEEGLAFIATWARATELKSHGFAIGDKITIRPVDKDFQINFITEAKFKEMKLQAEMDKNGEEP